MGKFSFLPIFLINSVYPCTTSKILVRILFVFFSKIWKFQSRAEKTFSEVDADSSGSVSKDELQNWLKILNSEEQREKTIFWLKKWDEDKSGTVSWDEYLKSFFIDGLEGLL